MFFFVIFSIGILCDSVSFISFICCIVRNEKDQEEDEEERKKSRSVHLMVSKVTDIFNTIFIFCFEKKK